MKRVLGLAAASLIVGTLAIAGPEENKKAVKTAAQGIGKLKALNKGVTEKDCGPTGLFEVDGEGCGALFEDFCNELHDEDHEGNITLGKGPKAFRLTLGDSHNGIDNAYVALARAKIEARNRLPQAFRDELNTNGYFDLLEKYLDSPKPKNKEEKIERGRTVDRLSARWNEAFNVAIKRDTASGTSRQATVNLERAISKAIWQESPAWKSIVEQTEQAREALIATINDFKIDAAAKKRMIDKIKSVELMLPDPVRDPGCQNTDNNAYYHDTDRKITVCAGMFNTMDSMATLLHEFSHAIDSTALAFDDLLDSSLGKSYDELEKRTCSSSDRMKCEDWENWKKQLSSRVAAVPKNKHPLDPMLRCLQGNKNFPKVDQNALLAEAKIRARTKMDKIAEDNEFLRLSKPFEPGSTELPNSSYLDPCTLKPTSTVREAFDLSLHHFFANEYRCSKATPNSKRMAKSLEFAEGAQTQLETALMTHAGQYSDFKWPLMKGYAQQVHEQAADLIGMKAFSRYLNQKHDDVKDRRNHFLASTADICMGADHTVEFPDEAEEEYKYTTEPHSLMVRRSREMLLPSLRQSLGCEKDFNAEDCLP